MMSLLWSAIAILCSCSQSLNAFESVPESLPPRCLGDLAALSTTTRSSDNGQEQESYCTPERFIEIEFKLKFGCNAPMYLEQGIRLEVQSREDGSPATWQEIRFYTPSLLSHPPDGSGETLVSLDAGNASVTAIASEYSSSLPLLLVNTSETVTIHEYLCGNYISYAKDSGKQLRFRWMQRYLTEPEAKIATWALDDIRIKIWNGTCFTQAVNENFTTTPPEGKFQIIAGVSRQLPCEESGESVLYFQRDPMASSVARRSLVVTVRDVAEECERVDGDDNDDIRDTGRDFEEDCPYGEISSSEQSVRISCSRGNVTCGCGHEETRIGRFMCSSPSTTEAPPTTTETPPTTTETPPSTTEAPLTTTETPPTTTRAPLTTTESPTTEPPPTTTEPPPTTTEAPPTTTETPPTTTETPPTIISPENLIDNIFEKNFSQDDLDSLIESFGGGLASREISERIFSNVNTLLQDLSYEDDKEAGGRLLSFLDTFALTAYNSSQGPIQTESYIINVKDVLSSDIPISEGVDALKNDKGSINLPKELFDAVSSPNDQPIRIASIIFKNISNILSQETEDDNVSMIVSPVVSATLGCGGVACQTRQVDLKEPIIIEIKHHQEITDGKLECYFYDIDRNLFSEDGCERDPSSNSTYSVCKCKHLTHFAILLSPGLNITGANKIALNIIGYVGVSISLIAMAITVFILCFLKSLWGMRNYIHINLCICLSISQLIFIVAVDKVDIKPLCQTIAIVLHYFFLVTFMWMLMEGVVLYVALVRVFIKKQRNYIILFTLVSYGVPAIYMFLVVPLGMGLRDGEGNPHYGNNEFCWLRYDTNFVFAFIAPVIVIILANIGFFIMAIAIMIKHERKGERKSKFEYANRWLRTSISLLVVMGITWLIGVLVFHQALIFVAYIFTIATAFQGTIIFILFILLSKQVRESYFSWWRSKKGESSVLSSMFATEMNLSLSRERFSNMRSTIRGTFRKRENTFQTTSTKEETDIEMSAGDIAKCKEAFAVEPPTHNGGVIPTTNIEPPRPNGTLSDIPKGHMTHENHTPNGIDVKAELDVIPVTSQRVISHDQQSDHPNGHVININKDHIPSEAGLDVASPVMSHDQQS